MVGGLARITEPPPNWRVSESRSERKRGHCRDVAYSVSNNNADGKPCKKKRPSTAHNGFPARTPKKHHPKTLNF